MAHYRQINPAHEAMGEQTKREQRKKMRVSNERNNIKLWLSLDMDESLTLLPNELVSPHYCMYQPVLYDEKLRRY